MKKIILLLTVFFGLCVWLFEPVRIAVLNLTRSDGPPVVAIIAALLCVLAAIALAKPLWHERVRLPRIKLLHGLNAGWLVPLLLMFFSVAHAQVVVGQFKSGISNIVTCTLVDTNFPGSLLVTNDVPLNTGISIAVHFLGTQSTNTGVLALKWYVSQDGTNYPSAPSFFTFHTANATTAVREWTNIPPAVLNNARKLKCGGVTNALANMASITVSNITLLRQ